MRVFREMRRRNQQLPDDECYYILQNATSGVLAVAGDDGYPYAVPLSFAYADGKLYFHVAKSGHKLDALRRSPKASFCVIAKDEIVPQKYTTYFSSVIAFGSVRIIEDDTSAEKRRGLDLLADKYCPEETLESREKEIGGLMKALCVLVMDIEHLTGKEGRELAEMRSCRYSCPSIIVIYSCKQRKFFDMGEYRVNAIIRASTTYSLVV